MNARRGLILVLAAFAAILSWLFWAAPETVPKAQSPAVTRKPRPSGASTEANPAPAEPRSELADRLNAPGASIQADLRIVSDVIDAYRSNFHENPVGTNAEITAALMGHNHLRLALIPQNHPAANYQRELCDRWGRPFFFHQLSGTQMEIRSSGPDKKMWTDDDVVLTPGE